MDRRSFLRAGAFAVTTAAGGTFLIGCAPTTRNDAANSTGDQTLPEVAFVTPFQHIINYIDVYVAVQEGFFEKEGLRVKPIGGTGTASSISQVTAGQGMFGKGAAVITSPLILDTGAEIITIGQNDQVSQYSVASDPTKPLNSPADWQGKTIGVISKGGTTELLLDAMSVTAGLDPTKVRKVVTGADVGSLEFLKRGEVDGFITFLGSETALRQRGVELNYLNTDKFAKMPGDSYFVKKSDAQSKGEEITGFLRACRKAYEFTEDKANLDKVLSAMGAFNAVEVSDKEVARLKIEAQAKLCKPANGKYLSIDMPAWESALELMRKSGIVKDKSRPLSDIVTAEFVDKV
ncbi:ABC transporter substrate-binding protein [Umezawaea tangerina]|uniref:ABC-type nitrate/sulfonate/bicarbonate transport system substrate-binding protein n=1 Tax=Umezawaea tangerina TaxID=84725 RepID=A0A2T0T2C4_9PSEU|nr:ABC transporter substrate-binding protein [Umezawaea tangerina]PRY39789.1 ABC-type nitrate/sulfonate/bicarbonate transport system substrate-binding protein [Umezawaea tangerina]